MFGAIFSALAQVAHTASQAVEEAGERMGVPKWITGGISGAISAVGHASDHAKDIELPSMGRGLSMMGDSIKTAIGGFSHEEAMPAQSMKVGRSADIHNAVVTELPNKSPFEVTMNDIQVPSLPMQVARSAGVGMGA